MLTEVADLEPQTFNEPKMIIRKIKYQLTTVPAFLLAFVMLSFCVCGQTN